MREVYCRVCKEPVGRVDLRGSTGLDVFLLEAQEQGRGFSIGIDHLTAEHSDLVALRNAQSIPLFPLIQVGEYNPLDSASRLPDSSAVRRGEPALTAEPIVL
jgi:hypothetical protein